MHCGHREDLATSTMVNTMPDWGGGININTSQ